MCAVVHTRYDNDIETDTHAMHETQDDHSMLKMETLHGTCSCHNAVATSTA